MTIQTAYKSDKAREKALASYEEILAQWPVPYEGRIVKTNFGNTYMIVSGSLENKPLVLLHGAGGNSTMWNYNVSALSKHFRIYAIDIIGEAGKSAGTRPTMITEYSQWLKEVLDALNINKVELCGASLGGTFAQQFALTFPHYVNSLILLAPPSLLKIRISFILRFILANLFPRLFARNFLQYMSSRSSELPEQAIQAFTIQLQAYKLNPKKIPLISDQDLTRLPLQTFLLLGKDEVLYDSEEVASRIQAVAPFITVAIIPGAKHLISVDQPDSVNEKIIQFLSQ